MHIGSYVDSNPHSELLEAIIKNVISNLISLKIEPRLDKNPFGNGFGPPGGPPGLNPMAAQFMALQHPAFLGQVSAAGLPAPFGIPPSVVTSSPSIPGRPEPQFMKGPNAASLASLEALQR